MRTRSTKENLENQKEFFDIKNTVERKTLQKDCKDKIEKICQKVKQKHKNKNKNRGKSEKSGNFNNIQIRIPERENSEYGRWRKKYFQ